MLVFFRIRRGGRVQTANMPPSRSDPAIRQVATDLTRENEQLVEGAERMRAQVKEWEELALGWRREAKRRRLYDEAAVKEVNHWYVEYYKLKHGEEPNPPYPPARGVGKAGEAERDRDPNSRDREDGREAERDREEAEQAPVFRFWEFHCSGIAPALLRHCSGIAPVVLRGEISGRNTTR